MPDTESELARRAKARYLRDPVFVARVENVLAQVRCDPEDGIVRAAVAMAVESMQSERDAEHTATLIARGEFLPPDHREALNLVGQLRGCLERMEVRTPTGNLSIASIHERSLDAIRASIVSHAAAVWHRATCEPVAVHYNSPTEGTE